MSALKDLKKRLLAVKSTKQLTSAMKTISSIKFSRINNISAGYKEYADRCGEMIKTIGIKEEPQTEKEEKTLYVLISGNRGLCGGYNIELFSFFDEIVNNSENALFMACGKKAIEHCRKKNIPLIMEFALPDIPDFSVATNLYDILNGFLADKTAEKISFICQKHINLLKRNPEIIEFLNPKTSFVSSEDDIIYVPDKETVSKKLYPFYQNNAIYSLLLNCAAGVQAATLTAMRSAYDTASESAQALEISINRHRQADVTASVIETAADNNYDLGNEV